LKPYHTKAVFLCPNLSGAVIFSAIFLISVILRQNHSSAFTFRPIAFPYEAIKIQSSFFQEAIAFIFGDLALKSSTF
jgi:hypothetical protein